MLEWDIGREIREAKEGSDVFGLVQKIAYSYHLKNTQCSSEENWCMAQASLNIWAVFQTNLENSSFKLPLEEALHQLLNNNAYNRFKVRDFWGDLGTSFGDWIYAQDSLAQHVIYLC